jgi:hypothetical protein
MLVTVAFGDKASVLINATMSSFAVAVEKMPLFTLPADAP